MTYLCCVKTTGFRHRALDLPFKKLRHQLFAPISERIHILKIAILICARCARV